MRKSSKKDTPVNSAEPKGKTSTSKRVFTSRKQPLKSRVPDDNIALKRIAELARLDLTEEELTTFESQLTPILKHIDTLAALDVEGIEPTAHPTPVFDVLRADTARPGLSPEAVLQNAPESAQGQIRVPKVVDAS